jgi:hypothetical protein
MIDISSLMAGLTFYHRKRLDGGIRTGIMLGGTTVSERFEEGQEDYDPSLIWSVDLRCSGAGLPDTADKAKQWLLDHERIIRDGFSRFAEQLRARSDPTGAYLLEWNEFPSHPEGVEMKIVCGAMRRVDALGLAATLRDVRDRWRELILSLSPTQPAMR